MSAKRAVPVDRQLRDAAVSACWRQWRALGASLSSSREPEATAVVDVEALILLSLALRPVERRLGDAVAWWAATASRFVSVQRLRSLARRGHAEVEMHLGLFAQSAVTAGDARWKGHAGKGRALESRALKGTAQPRLLQPVALMPRLRAAFGVGAKADVLLFLLTASRTDPTARELTAGLDYTTRAVRAAADDMAWAGLIEGSDSRPRRYSVRRSSWAEVLLGKGTLPPWRPFARVYSLVVQVLSFHDAQDSRSTSAYLRASAARDLLEAHARGIAGTDGLPALPKALGQDYLGAFDEFVGALAGWLQRNV